ncbi:NUDIX hydrolase [Roseovarius sp. SYSU LYC5161]|jgi:8-oxo-dGTP pyrophosphatase MutT (NUDIX family)|uniref:NUDIX hydrolase n=1 Tax=Roseovarius halophilus (ex Wu et al. 2025) TaxID=3376060 RepID=UPI0028715EA4|nr:NUDIX hydrolase [Roseovarius sp.]
MTLQKIKQDPISLNAHGKRDLRTQFAALCYRIKGGKPEFLLITSRGSGRWIIPKGWPVDGRTPGESALTEAWEEAGVQGRVIERCIGLFSYHKEIGDTDGSLPCLALVYPVKVKALARRYPEAGQRRRRWLGRRKAAEKVSDPELARIIRDFDAARLKG